MHVRNMLPFQLKPTENQQYKKEIWMDIQIFPCYIIMFMKIWNIYCTPGIYPSKV